MSFLNINTKLLNYEIKEKQMVLTFNEDILSSIEDKSILEEVINTINYSIDDNYDVNEVIFRVGEEEILKGLCDIFEIDYQWFYKNQIEPSRIYI